jgi:hypothetical protein
MEVVNMLNTVKTIKQSYENLLGAEVIGVDGVQAPYSGTVKKLSVYAHKVLGILAQVWVEWEGQNGHLTPYNPKQFKQWEGQRQIGVYYAQSESGVI